MFVISVYTSMHVGIVESYDLMTEFVNYVFSQIADTGTDRMSTLTWGEHCHKIPCYLLCITQP